MAMEKEPFSELTIADSIAIKVLPGGAILTGVGNELHLYAPKVGRRMLSQRLRAKVHGIANAQLNTTCSQHGRLIVYGEKECMLLQYVYVKEEYNFSELYHFHLTDWISSASFLQDPNEFILLTSHSVALRILYNENDEKRNFCRVIAKSSAEDKSTLYCTHIHGQTWEELVIFGGTAFGELLIWKPFVEGDASRNDSCTVFDVGLKRRQQAHSGVVFSIDFDVTSGILTTTSDDRSIRFWKLQNTSPDNWNGFNLTAIASGYGHVARVFQGKIINFYEQQFGVTVGEDSYVCVWKTNGELVFKTRVQFGAVIWDFEYDKNTNTLYTVGSTGNLVAFNLNDVLKNKADMSAAETVLTGCEPKEYIAKAKFFDVNMLIGVTNNSRLMHTSLKLKTETNELESQPWKVVDVPNSFKCTVLEVHDNYIAICGYKKLIMYKYAGEGTFQKIFDGDIMHGVIRAFHFLGNCTFLISDDEGNCLLLEGESFQHPIAVPLPHCKEPWTTAALRIQTLKRKEFLIISNRMGNILLFSLDVATAICSLLDTLRQPHGALGATMLRVQDLYEELVFIQSAGHDGSLRLLCVEIGTGTIASHQRMLVPVAWVERFIAIETLDFILGFNDNHFVVWSQHHDFSVQVPCGGGHRSWHYQIKSDIDNTRFLQLLFIKNKKLRLHEYKLYNDPAISQKLFRNQWHTRSCNALQLIKASSHNVGLTVLVSCGDDNMVKVSKLMPGGRLEQSAEIQTHISNVRALQVIPMHSDIALIVSGGGRAQLCITQLNLKTFRIKDLLNYTLNRSGLIKGLVKCYRPDPETRIMACAVVEANKNNSSIDTGYAIFLGCSDGYLRKVLVDGSFGVVSEVFLYYGHCLLQMRAFANSVVVTAGTDGNLRFFDLELIELPINLQHHDSGINAMDIQFEPKTGVLHLLTGGDDQSVSYTSLNLEDSKKLRVINKYHFANAHLAQVTAVKLFFNGNKIYAYTCGLDQIINMVDIQTQRIELIGHTCISDPKGLVLDNCKRFFVYGCGIQVLKFKR
ncbi:WD repeat-containing protein 6 [Rhagoletis pomonella]|uniref:WD repeat-containing protein 6 n=1 Tax=Rhagoletis pomonella TaxID=28610 RepID=UPI00177C7C90|nr:WD repeat-containing protein 6 [Rhagoletis pomonella]